MLDALSYILGHRTNHVVMRVIEKIRPNPPLLSCQGLSTVASFFFRLDPIDVLVPFNVVGPSSGKPLNPVGLNPGSQNGQIGVQVQSRFPSAVMRCRLVVCYAPGNI